MRLSHLVIHTDASSQPVLHVTLMIGLDGNIGGDVLMHHVTRGHSGLISFKGWTLKILQIQLFQEAILKIEFARQGENTLSRNRRDS